MIKPFSRLDVSHTKKTAEEKAQALLSRAGADDIFSIMPAHSAPSAQGRRAAAAFRLLLMSFRTVLHEAASGEHTLVLSIVCEGDYYMEMADIQIREPFITIQRDARLAYCRHGVLMPLAMSDAKTMPMPRSAYFSRGGRRRRCSLLAWRRQLYSRISRFAIYYADERLIKKAFSRRGDAIEVSCAHTAAE